MQWMSNGWFQHVSKHMTEIGNHPIDALWLQVQSIENVQGYDPQVLKLWREDFENQGSFDEASC